MRTAIHLPQKKPLAKWPGGVAVVTGRTCPGFQPNGGRYDDSQRHETHGHPVHRSRARRSARRARSACLNASRAWRLKNARQA
jgi:hypothetical protein